MNIVFISNYINHHQISLCEALCKETKDNYYFIATSELTEERKKLGYKTYDILEYHKFFDENPEECKRLINNADVVIMGSAPDFLIKDRIRSGKIIFKYSERPLKRGLEIKKYIPRLIKWNLLLPRWKPIYLLSASAFAPSDYKKFGLFPKKKYKWGYFPKTIKYNDLETLRLGKNTKEILWVGRFLDWKRPDDALEIAKKLKVENYDFKLKFIGCGEEEAKLKNLISLYKLENNVEILGAMPPEEVRKHMERAGVFLFTSTKQEGWGAVLNEAMNSCCAVVASDLIGAVPYLINETNGFTYKDGDMADFYDKVKFLLDNPERQWAIGAFAYKTITEIWNAHIASKRLVKICEALMSGEKYPDLFEDGPCSRC